MYQDPLHRCRRVFGLLVFFLLPCVQARYRDKTEHARAIPPPTSACLLNFRVLPTVGLRQGSISGLIAGQLQHLACLAYDSTVPCGLRADARKAMGLHGHAAPHLLLDLCLTFPLAAAAIFYRLCKASLGRRLRMDLEAKDAGDVLRSGLRHEVRKGHHGQVGECCPKVGPVCPAILGRAGVEDLAATRAKDLDGVLLRLVRLPHGKYSLHTRHAFSDPGCSASCCLSNTKQRIKAAATQNK